MIHERKFIVRVGDEWYVENPKNIHALTHDRNRAFVATYNEAEFLCTNLQKAYGIGSARIGSACETLSPEHLGRFEELTNNDQAFLKSCGIAQ